MSKQNGHSPRGSPHMDYPPGLTPPTYVIAASNSSTTDDDDRLANTVSLSAEVTDYPVHWGRTYHRYREGAYLFPNDEIEIERLDLQHVILNKYFDGLLVWAPVDRDAIQRVLDIGTGTGIWAIELAESDLFPNAIDITGIDLSPIQPVYVPANVHFEVQDCTEADWCRPLGSISYIHSRFMAGALESYKDLMEQSLKYLTKGSGWIEIHELSATPRCDDGTMPDDWKFKDWEDKMHYASTQRLNPPRPLRVGHELQQWLKEAGYVDVNGNTGPYKIPIGAWAKNKVLKQCGALWARNWMEGLPGFSYKLFGQDGLGWSRNEIELEMVEVRQSLAQKEVHAYMEYYVAWGRRPTDEEAARTEGAGESFAEYHRPPEFQRPPVPEFEAQNAL